MVPVPNSSLAGCVRVALAVALISISVSCASSRSIRMARAAESSQNYDVAVAEYTKLLRDNPNSREARQGLERAKLRAAQDHHSKGRRLTATGKLEEALAEFQ